MKVLILDNNCTITTYLSEVYFKDNSQYNVITMNQNHIDITDYNDTIKKIIKLSPDVVIHGAEISNIDFCEFNDIESRKINVNGTNNVATACNILDIPLVYISASEVYGNGTKTPFTEDDICSPINIYGKSKLEGETIVNSTCKKHFIIRASWCFGGQDCYVKKIIDNKDIPIFATPDEVVNPTNINDLCIMIEKIMTSKTYGTYNCSGETFASKINVIKYVLSLLGLDKKVIPLPEETRKVIAPRSSFSALDTTKMKKTFNVKTPNWEQSIKIYLNTIL